MTKNWTRLETTNSDREKIHGKNRSFAGDVWFRFRRKPTAISGFILMLLLLAFSILGPFFTHYSYSQQDLNVVNIPPLLKVYQAPDGVNTLYINQNMKLQQVDSNRKLGAQLPKLGEDAENKIFIFDDNGTQVGLYYGSKPYLVCDPETKIVADSTHVWNGSYALGTDNLGRDILTRLMYGMRVSLLVAAIAALVNLLIGILYGGISGYCGGVVDNVMMRIVDVISTIPLTLYVILIMVLLGSGMTSIIVALGSVYWVDMARVVRGETLRLRNEDFVLAAKSIGSRTSTILGRHIIPNALGSILVTVTMLIPSAIFMEAFLGYLGIGLQPPLASLGTMCNDAMENLRSSPYQLFFPALMICLIMFAFNFIGDGLRDAMDPKLKK